MYPNTFLNSFIEVSPHARQRWGERISADDSDIAEYLEKALPFGPQYSDRESIAHNGVVFKIKKTGRHLKKTLYTLVTVLTEGQVEASRQMYIQRGSNVKIGYVGDYLPQPQPQPLPLPPAAPVATTTTAVVSDQETINNRKARRIRQEIEDIAKATKLVDELELLSIKIDPTVGDDYLMTLKASVERCLKDRIGKHIKSKLKLGMQPIDNELRRRGLVSD